MKADLLDSGTEGFGNAFVTGMVAGTRQIVSVVVFLIVVVEHPLHRQQQEFRYNSMDKFRNFKGRLVSSKRESQKISEEELCCARDRSLGRMRLYLSAKLQHDVHRIRQQNYKISACSLGQTMQLTRKSQESNQERPKQHKTQQRRESKQRRPKQDLLPKQEIEFKQLKTEQFSTTIKKTAPNNSTQQRESFSRILHLMRQINRLQQRRDHSAQGEAEWLSREISLRQRQVRQLMKSMEDSSQRSLLDFYGEQGTSPSSSDSFNSHNSDKTYQLNSEREALELSDEGAQENLGQFQIKYRRISVNSPAEEQAKDLGNETFLDEEEGLPESPISGGNIVHLFSYDQDKELQSPLSKISERDSQYYSPDSKNFAGNSLFSGESLEYKKIFYLLQTTDKKMTAQASVSHEGQVSEFKGDSNRQNSILLQSIDRSRCREQLSQMIALLENKYNRKVRQQGPQNLMRLLNEPCRVNVSGAKANQV